MRTLILYYSGTGNTRKVAAQLAEALAATVGEITCQSYTRGFWGPFRQAFDVLRGSSPAIELPELAGQNWDLVLVGSPVWGARPAPPIRSYLQGHAARHARLALFVTCKGTSPSHPPEKAIAEMASLAPGRSIESHIFTEAQIGGAGLDAEVASFARALQASA